MADPRRLLAKVMTERELHSYVADLLRLTARRDVLWFHPVNEGKRSERMGAFLLRQGMLPGVSDLVVVIRGQAHFMELKTAKGRLSPEQWAFADAAVAAGAKHAIARAPEQAKEILGAWGALRPESVADIVRRFNRIGAVG